MKPEDFALIRNIAVSIEGFDLRLSYKLLSLVDKYCENDSSDVKRIDLYREQLFGMVLTARTDGTTERINAIVNGLLLSRKFGLNFYFSWVGKSANTYHCTTEELPDIFSDEFVEQHFKPFDFFQRYTYSKLDKRPNSELANGSQVRGSSENREKVIEDAKLKKGNIVPATYNYGNNYSGVIGKVFNQKYLDIKKNKAISQKNYIAIHYRGGDVIYGVSRFDESALFGKSACLSMIERIISENKSSNILLFGTPINESLDDLKFLKSKYKNITLASELHTENLNPVIEECFFMGLCQQVYSTKGTGVVRLATKISPDIRLVYYDEVFSEKELFMCLLSGVDNHEYNSLQRANHARKALSMAMGLEDELKTQIAKLDPQ